MTPQQRKQLIIAAVLGVALVAVVIYQVRGASGSKKTSGSTGKAAAAKKAGEPVELLKADIDVKALVESVQPVDFNYNDARIERDVMRPLVGADMVVGNPAELLRDPNQSNDDLRRQIYVNAIREKVVSGIVYDEDRPCAVVDNEIVFRGTELPLGITVVDIGSNYVVFRGGDVELPVGLKE